MKRKATIKTPYAPALYRSPIDLPEQRSGKLAVEHFTIEGKVSVVGMRQGLLTGTGGVSAMLDKPRRCHRLVEDGVGTWMTDLPEELNQIGAVLHALQPRGRVLVGGLGLGLLSSVLAGWPEVDTLVTVERSEDVIALCSTPLIHIGGPHHRVVQADIYEYVAAHHAAFNYYLLDTWQMTSEVAWWTEVMPLRRAIRRQHGLSPKVWCWAEDIMRGQIGMSLTNSFNKDNPRTHWYYRGLPRMSQSEFDFFFDYVGCQKWERRYGGIIDATIAAMRKEVEEDETTS